MGLESFWKFLEINIRDVAKNEDTFMCPFYI